MIFDIHFENQTSFEKGMFELDMLASQLMGDMRICRVYSVKRKIPSISVELEEIDDTIALMKTLKEMANKDIHWQLNADWWANADKED